MRGHERKISGSGWVVSSTSRGGRGIATIIATLVSTIAHVPSVHTAKPLRHRLFPPRCRCCCCLLLTIALFLALALFLVLALALARDPLYPTPTASQRC